MSAPLPFGFWVGTGSRNETDEINGVSHFLEHMMFKGTKKRTARQLAEAFDEIGGQVNAFTSKELTCYYAKVLDQLFFGRPGVFWRICFSGRRCPMKRSKRRKR